MTAFAVDTSVAIPLLLGGHPQHAAVTRWASDHQLALAGHAEVEAYLVLTRLPDPLGIDAASALRAITTGFAPPVHPTSPEAAVRRIAAAGATGGAVYDALVAIAAADAGLPLATRDARALPTYARLGARVEIVV